MEEFALCWNKLKFAENLSSGFQSLFDRGDFVDCTIACDGQLLQCHKLVLAICSPYFREIFMSNPCRHPIIILKDVTYSIMSELLQFMYQGEVNVKQAELQSFMSIAESLQIKGLATNSGSNNNGANNSNHSNNNNNNNTNNNSSSNSNNSTMRSSDAMNSSYSQFHSNNVSGGGGTGAGNNTGVHRNHNQHQFNSGGNHMENHRQTTSTPLSTSSSMDGGNHAIKGSKQHMVDNSTPSTSSPSSSSYAQKRTIDQISEQQQQRHSQMKMKKSLHDVSDSDMNDSIDNMTSDDIFLPASMQPQVTISESPRFDVNTVKRESSSSDLARPSSPGIGYRNSYHNSNSMQNTSFPYYPDFSSGDLSINNNSMDLSKSHMEVPPGTHSTSVSNVTMLSATSLLHNSMIFNRNSTVATQQGMKTYWLCRSYRLTTCRARCITHQGQLISATGQHNHPAHVKSSSPTATVSSNNFKLDESTSGCYNNQQQMSNQIQSMSTTTNLTMINQQQGMSNFGMPTNGSSSHFSMSNIHSNSTITELPDIDPNTILMHASAVANQLDSNIQITPIINSSIDDLHMHSLSSDITIHDASNIHNIAITSANN